MNQSIIAACVCVLAFCAMAQAGQTPQKLEKQITIKLNYLLYLPDDYEKNADAKYPLVMFLHGSGERGDDLKKVAVHGPPKLVEGGKSFPFILVSPQCPANEWWDLQALIMLLDDTQAKYRVDPDRVYLTGLSMGGFATWDLSIRQAGRFAAVAPICGAGNPSMAFRMKDLPVWAFHGDADTAVPVQRSEEMVEALKKVNAPEVKFTKYPGVGHDSWTRTYENPEFWEWLLSHKRQPKKAAPAK